MSELLPDRGPITFDDILATMAGQVRLAYGEHKITAEQYERYLGIDPDGLRRAAAESAADEFAHAHGMGPLAVARLRNLTASQRTAARQALIETAEAFFRTGMTLAYIRAGVLGGQPDDEGDPA